MVNWMCIKVQYTVMHTHKLHRKKLCIFYYDWLQQEHIKGILDRPNIGNGVSHQL